MSSSKTEQQQIQHMNRSNLMLCFSLHAFFQPRKASSLDTPIGWHCQTCHHPGQRLACLIAFCSPPAAALWITPIGCLLRKKTYFM